MSRRDAFAAVYVLGGLLFGSARAATVSSESSMGVATNYNSNPYLLPADAHAAESAAVLLNLPITYNSAATSFDLAPRFRFAQTRGAEALLSNYQYLDSDWKLLSDRNTFSASAAWHHDSTLYNEFENGELSGRSLGRLEQTAALDWQRALSERGAVHLSGSWDKVDYSQSNGTGLANFNYGQGSARYDWSLSERWQWSTTAGVGDYELLDRSNRSEQRFVQTSLSRALSERWSMSAQIGYSHLSSSTQGSVCSETLQIGNNLYCLQFAQVQQTTSGGSGNYVLSVERKSERFVLDAAVSRAIEPSGLGGLLTQDDVSVRDSYEWTERWTLNATLHAARLADALQGIQLGDRRNSDVDLGAVWQWTEHWTLQLQAALNWQRINLQDSSNVALSLTLSRQLGHFRLD